MKRDNDPLTHASSGWMNTDTIAWIMCERCGAQPGEPCHSPNGRRVGGPHVERSVAFTHDPRYDAGNYRISGAINPLSDLLNNVFGTT